MVRADLPDLIVRKTLMRKGRLSPTAVKKTKAGILVGKVVSRYVDDAPVLNELQRALSAVSLYQSMNLTHTSPS